MTEQLKLIHAELVRIREALEARPYAAGAPPTKPASSVAKTDEVPMPTEVIPNAGYVQVHFGKNNGKALSDLTERQLGFYASVKTPRLDNSGKPFPPRPQDVALEQAARTLWHQQKGTLVTAPAAATDSVDVPY